MRPARDRGGNGAWNTSPFAWTVTLGVSYAIAFTSQLSFGVQLRFIQEKLYTSDNRGIDVSAEPVNNLGGTLTPAGQAKALRMHNWLNRATVVTEIARYDMIRPVYDRATRQVVLDPNAANVLNVEVYGGDCVCVPHAAPVLIDLNDWPSYASCRTKASKAIAAHLQALPRTKPNNRA